MAECVDCEVVKDAGRLKTGEPKLPKGWKRLGQFTYCRACWQKRYVLRAITLPVSGPIDCEWKDLGAVLREGWIATTQASNWMMRQLMLADTGMTAEGKLSSMPKTYLYPMARQLFPQLPARVIVSLENSITSKYRKQRKNLCTYRMSLPTMRYPTPLPVPSQGWAVEETPDGMLVMSVDLPGGRKRLRLRGGAGYRRQRSAIRKLIRGVAIAGEAAIYRVAANPGDHRGGDTPKSRVMAKLVMWLERDQKNGDNTASIVLGEDCLLKIYDHNNEQILKWNEDHLLRRIVRHDKELQRLREDLKAERRVYQTSRRNSDLEPEEREKGRRENKGILSRMAQISLKQRNYLQTASHRATAMVVKLLQRRRVKSLACTDRALTIDEEGNAKQYLPHFPWYMLKQHLADKCYKAGIEVKWNTTGEEPVD